MTGIPSLRGLQAVEAAARSGSFVAASEELAISAAAISQLIRTLEDQVGRKLFHRLNRRVVLTEAGVEIFPRLANAFGELRSVLRELTSAAGFQTSGVNQRHDGHREQFHPHHAPISRRRSARRVTSCPSGRSSMRGTATDRTSS